VEKEIFLEPFVDIPPDTVVPPAKTATIGETTVQGYHWDFSVRMKKAAGKTGSRTLHGMRRETFRRSIILKNCTKNYIPAEIQKNSGSFCRYFNEMYYNT